MVIDSISLGSHRECATLSELFQGKLCDQLQHQPARSFAPGEFIFLRGGPARSVYYLRAGLVKTSLITADGEEVIVAVHKAGEIFGEMCFCAGERREQAQAMEQTEVVEIGIEAMISRLQADRQVMLDFLTRISRRLTDAYDQVEALAFEKIPRRLARRLLQLAEEFGEPGPNGLEIQHYVRQEELAQMIGAAREVTSSALNDLRALGLVNYTRRGLITVNRDRLHSFLGSSDPS